MTIGGPVGVPPIYRRVLLPAVGVEWRWCACRDGGGGLPAGGLGGLGGGNPVSALTSGPGNLPGATSAGLSGVPGGSAGATGVPGSRGDGGSVGVRAWCDCGFGCRWGGSAGESASCVGGNPPPAAGPTAGGSSSAPVMPAGLAASGAHTPAPPVAAPSWAAGGAPAPSGGMMLPPPGMGGPAAQGISTGGAPTGAITGDGFDRLAVIRAALVGLRVRQRRLRLCRRVW